PRQPQLFSTDDPKLNDEPLPAELTLEQPSATLPAEDGVLRPTLEFAGRGWPWGGLFLAAAGSAASLAASAWLLRLLTAARARDDGPGWRMLGLLRTAAFAFVMLLLRELVGFPRPGRLNRLRREVDAALSTADAKRERRAAEALVHLYRARADLAWGMRRFGEHAGDVRDAGEVLTLAERELIVPLDREARRIVLSAAKRVATVTALSP